MPRPEDVREVLERVVAHDTVLGKRSRQVCTLAMSNRLLNGDRNPDGSRYTGLGQRLGAK